MRTSLCITLLIKIIKRRGSRRYGNYFFKKFSNLRERGDSLSRKFCVLGKRYLRRGADGSGKEARE